MHKELPRLATFSKWSKPCKSSPMQLARRGIYYSTALDRLVCYRCGCSLPDPNDIDDPLELHGILFPNCDLQPPMHIDNNFPVASSASGHEEPLENLLLSAWNRASANRRFEPDNAPDRVQPDFDMLRSERVRLGTFHDWPATANAGPERLAREGFFYRGSADRVQCVFCRGSLSSWQPRDEPRLEHWKHFPDCPFVRGLDVDNIPLDASRRPCGTTSSITGATTVPRQMEVLQTHENQRLLGDCSNEQTEVRISNQLGVNREADVVARMNTPAVRAVLDMDYSEDTVRAVLSIKLAQTGTDFPNAESLLEAIFQSENEPPTQFDHNSAAATIDNETSMLDNMLTSTDINEFSNPTASIMAGGTSDSSQSNEYSVCREMLDDSAMSTAHSATISLPVVGSTDEQRLSNPLSLGANLSETEISLKPSETPKLSEAETKSTTKQSETIVKRKGKKKRNRKKLRPAASSNQPPVQGKISENSRGSNIEETTDEDEVVRYLLENQQLRDARTCKVCMDSEVSTVFLPCGHLVCCDRCSPQLRDCPVCRNFIRGTVKTCLN